MGVDTENTEVEQCETCGGFYVNPAGHKCRTINNWLTSKPNRTVIEELAKEDDGDPDDSVVHSSTRASRAYHQTEDGEEPSEGKCRNALRGEDSEWETTTREEAKADDRFPCTRCHDIDTQAVEARLIDRGEIRGN